MCLKARVDICVSAVAAGLSMCPRVSAMSHSSGDTRASSSTITAIATEAHSAR